MTEARLLAFDTASLYFRAFYGLPSSMRAPDGRPVNAIRGILDFIARLTTQYQPTHLACAWDDDWRPAWRVELIPSYKAHRVADADAEEVPDELSPQVPLIRQALEMLQIPVIGFEDYEADDVLGSLAAKFDGEVLVVTGDRDLFQLAQGNNKVIYVARGVAKHDLVDNAWVQHKYDIPASAYVDYSVLRGDASDGLPGVAGVGEKSAATLLGRFGDLDGIVAAAADPASGMAAGVRAKIAGSIDYLAAAREVVQVADDLPIPPLAAIADTEVDAQAFEAFSAALALGGSATRVLQSLKSSAN